MSDKLPEMTFKIGDHVWTPSAGFCVLQGPTLLTDLFTDGLRHYDDRGREYSHSSNSLTTSRAILTLDEAAKLGLTPPKVKRKERRYAFLDQTYGKLIFGKSPDEMLGAAGWTRAPWLDGEVEIDGE